jgi:phage host-nuclease inhibitor protein Gam
MTDESLEEFLLDAGQPENFDPTTFIINDEEEGLWAMRSLAVAQRKIDAIEYRAATERERIDTWCELSTKSSRNTVQYFELALESFAVRMREEGVKTLTFPDGYVSSRSTPAKVVVENADLFVKWCETTAHSDWVRVKKEPDIAAIKSSAELVQGSVVDSSGEVAEGLLSVDGSVSVTITVSE